MKHSTKTTRSMPDSGLKIQLAVIALSLVTSTALADMATAPLFLTTNVKPNIMLMLDNSFSMAEEETITSPGTNYDPSITYPANANCSSTPMSDTDSINNNSTCSSAGGTWSNSTCKITITNTPNNSANCTAAGGTWSNSTCKKTITTKPHIYSTSISTGFYGNGTGTKCFSSAKNYTTNLSLPASVTTPTQKANYLNWYYSNEIAKQGTTLSRLTIVKNAATTMVDMLNDDVRLGLSRFNSDDGGYLLETVDTLDALKKAGIKTKISEITANASTPLAETMADIGRYYAAGSSNITLRAGNTNELTVPTVNALPSSLANVSSSTPNPIQYSCQKSFAVVLTDGLPSADQEIVNNYFLRDYDGDCSGANSSKCGKCKKDDGSDCSLTDNNKWYTNGGSTKSGDPDDRHYDMKRLYNYPFQCNNKTTATCVAGGSNANNSSDYFDDVTQALFEMDLRTDLRNDNESAKAKNNLTTYVIGFADPAINPATPGVNPLPKNAAIRGGGKFYYAGNEADLTAGLISAMQFISETNGSSSSVATNSTQFQTDTLIYQAIFDSSDWTGDLLAYKLTTEDTNGNGKLDTGEDTNNNGKIDAGEIGATLWKASEQVPAADDRNIYSYDGTKGIAFKWGELNASQKAILGTEPVLDYLRGGQDKEKSHTGGIYRNRSSLLGDIVNSDPLFVGHDNFGYATLPEGSDPTTKYEDFIAESRREMIYVAANDGMLHGFDASIGAEGGKEIFAYIPNAAITSALASLTDPNYNHKYINDGSPQAGDLYFNNAWHTVLIGGLGAGGKALYALDITDPDAFYENNVLWEFTDADLGYTLPQVNIVRTANIANPWVAIVANGYNSSSGKAALYIINIQTGTIVKKIEAETAGNNGLSSPITVDVDNDKIADYVYAGDLKGNMWKFDISSSDSSNWGVAYNGAPLFIATDTASPAATQAITSKPAVSKATATGQTTGTMVYFGTGKYFETNDNDVPNNPQIQSFYAIWDICDKTSAVGCNGAVTGRTALQQQSIFYEGSSGITDGGDVRLTTNCEVAYGTTVPTTTTSPCTTNINRRGWYLDLLSPSAGPQGERIVSTPLIRHGVIIFPTLIPITTPCTPGGASWLMELDQFFGSRLSGGTPIDLNNDGNVDDKDLIHIGDKTYAASGFKSTVGIIDTPAIINCEDGIDCKYASGSSGNMIMKKEKAPGNPPNPPNPPAAITGHRTSWRQLH